MNAVSSIQEEIRNRLAIYAANGDTSRAINNGLCEEFACEVQAALRAAGVAVDVVYTEDCEQVEMMGGHAWIRFAGVCFDAETPSGVLSPAALPFFQRELLRQSKTKLDTPSNDGPSF